MSQSRSTREGQHGVFGPASSFLRAFVLATHAHRIQYARAPARCIRRSSASDDSPPPLQTWPSPARSDQAGWVLAQMDSTHVSTRSDYDSQMSDGEPPSVTVATLRSIVARRIKRLRVLVRRLPPFRTVYLRWRLLALLAHACGVLCYNTLYQCPDWSLAVLVLSVVHRINKSGWCG